MVRAWTLAALLFSTLLLAVGCGGPAGAPSAAAIPDSDLGESRYAAPKTAEASAVAAPLPQPPLVEAHPQRGSGPGRSGDKYAYIEENAFIAVKDSPLSTFAIDVDTASYAKLRGYLLANRTLPPLDAVRIEELINYFKYDYAAPADEHPLAVHIETAQCPWEPRHRLVRLGLQAKRMEDERRDSNLVFLIDVSGSMSAANKLPLVKRALGMLVQQLGENDRVSIVVYAGAAGQVLPPTSGSDQPTILAAIERLRAGGSTNGGQGIHLAYQIAQENFIRGGVNRVLLCTDGDFNVGVTSTGDLVRLAADRAQSGVYLSILGFGFGNHNDELLEQLSSKANGNYAFIDNDQEARKVLVEQMQGTLVTVAKDVKLQVEFNPAQVGAYRLIGYENRRLADPDFNNDRKDAGDIGAGHSVTALYEIIPLAGGAEFGRPEVDPLKYQASRSESAELRPQNDENSISRELLTLKVRYQPPQGGPSTLLTYPVKDRNKDFDSASPDFQFATAVASFGMLLRNSQHKGATTYGTVLATAAAARGADRDGRRGEFLELVKAAQDLTGEPAGRVSAAWQSYSPTALTVPPPSIPRSVRSRADSDDSLATFFFGILVGIRIALVVGVVLLAAVLSLRQKAISYAVPPLQK